MVAIKLSEDINNVEVPGWRLVQYPIAGKNKLILIATAYHVLVEELKGIRGKGEGGGQKEEALRDKEQGKGTTFIVTIPS